MTVKSRFDKPLLAIFASYYKPHWKIFAADMFCALLISVVDLSFPMMTKYTIERLLPRGLFGFFFFMVGMMLFIYFLRMGFVWFVTYWGHTVGAYIEVDMRRDLFSHLQRLSFSFYDNNRTGQIMSRVTTDLFEVTELAHHGPEDLFISFLTLAGSFVLVFTIRREMALVLLAVVPLMALHAVLSRREMQRAARRVKERTAEINVSIESSISGARVAKAFTNESYETGKFRGGNEKYKDARKAYYRTMAFFQSRMEFMTSFLMVVVIAAGGFLILQDKMNLTELITCNLFVNAFLQPIRRLQNFIEQFTNGMAGFSRFVEIMRIEPDIRDRPGAAVLENVRGDIEYRGVSFSYSRTAGRTGGGAEQADGERPVLRNINLSIPAGTVCALVGPSGGGKTTLCHLLPRFYEIHGGSITIDGRDIRDVTLESLRRNIGIVQQDVFLFAGSIRENIGYGRTDASAE
ncbi:MAG: ABC transporter ATP-binding protein, partial [Treponema sp.]|nr:ABC transporter ATP-binding protein [Treponema sp.]